MVLVLSSLVAGSRVGGGVSVSALQAKGIDTMHVPTVLLGRHPGWGVPGGGAIADDLFSGALDGIEANGLFALTDAVLTGYFATPGQVKRAAEAIDAIRAVQSRTAHNVCAYAPEPIVVVDPIIGDHGKPYVPDAVAQAIRDELVPRADLVTPNAFELAWLTGLPVRDAGEALTAARSLGRPVLASSIPAGKDIGIVFADAHAAHHVTHPKLDKVPTGTGDLLTARFLAERLLGAAPPAALGTAATVIWDTLLKAAEWNAFELPDVSARLHPVRDDARLAARPVTG